ncbi:MAG TPA: hypothetical protein DD672_06965 [Gammaproteobacteria bacterium]|nr:MAG: hypothetical protein CBD23_001110 [Gammaproteobacteria bacterium TMED163]HBJ89398.1 hypothetical protein [Gammaproteobacteria bacterium]HBQ00204.1 hypothetical protein [Gammaproteobacteria bacterium]
MMKNFLKTWGTNSLYCVLACALPPSALEAATIVNVQTNLGTFKLELFEDKAPATVAKFLANIEAGLYQFSMFHETGSTSVRGGLYFYNSCGEGPVPAPGITTIPLENTGLLNTTRTIAMVPTASDLNSVGSEWVINLGNNESIYPANAKPVVFGEVTEGLNTVDSIADAWRVPMDISPSVPTVNYGGIPVVQCGLFNAENVLKMAMQIESIDPPSHGGGGGDGGNTATATNYFDPATGLLNIKVDAGASGLLSLALRLESENPIIIQAQPETVSTLTETEEGISTFDASTSNLTIPEIEISGQIAYRNVVFRLTDPENLFFTLISAGTP